MNSNYYAPYIPHKLVVDYSLELGSPEQAISHIIGSRGKDVPQYDFLSQFDRDVITHSWHEYNQIHAWGIEFYRAVDALPSCMGYDGEHVLVDTDQLFNKEIAKLIMPSKVNDTFGVIRWFYEKYGVGDSVSPEEAERIARLAVAVDGEGFIDRGYTLLDILLKFPVTDVAMRRLAIVAYYWHSGMAIDKLARYYNRLIPEITLNCFACDDEEIYVVKVGNADDEEYTDVYAVIDRLIAMGAASFIGDPSTAPSMLHPYLKQFEFRYRQVG